MPQSRRRSLRAPQPAHRTTFGSRSYGPHNRKPRTTASDQVARKIITIAEQPVIELAPEDIPAPVQTRAFSEFHLPEVLKTALSRAHMSVTTPIQDQTIELGLAGKDVVGLANTGTGKTAAFLIPIIVQLLRAGRNGQALVLAPTRELAIQINNEFLRLAKGAGLRSVVVVGGANAKPQQIGLSRRPHLVVATPGRLTDFIKSGVWKPVQCNMVVLDEVDRMLDIGFIRDIERILSEVPTPHQSLFFSATMPADVAQIVERFSNQAVTVSVKTRETAAAVRQEVIRTTGNEDKLNVLSDRLRTSGYDRVIVFGRTKHGVDRLAKQLRARNFRVEAIHGNRSQGQRTRALGDFRAGKAQALIATDVAARGIDIPQVSHVINYDIPATYEDYVHRIGRTGRADAAGHAITFIPKAAA